MLPACNLRMLPACLLARNVAVSTKANLVLVCRPHPASHIPYQTTCMPCLSATTHCQPLRHSVQATTCTPPASESHGPLWLEPPSHRSASARWSPSCCRCWQPDAPRWGSTGPGVAAAGDRALLHVGPLLHQKTRAAVAPLGPPWGDCLRNQRVEMDGWRILSMLGVFTEHQGFMHLVHVQTAARCHYKTHTRPKKPPNDTTSSKSQSP